MSDPKPIVLGPWVLRPGSTAVWRRHIGDQVAVTCWADSCWTIFDDLEDFVGYGSRDDADRALLSLYPDAVLQSAAPSTWPPEAT